MPQKFNYGGQAVIEGVMMRGSKNMAVAVRAPDKTIAVHEELLTSSLYVGRLSRVPFVRGLSLLWDALGLGTRALMYSANIAEGTSSEAGTKRESTFDLNGPGARMLVIISLAFLVGMFFIAPRLVVDGISLLLSPVNAATGLGIFGNIVEGVIRITLTIGYIWVIGRLPEMQRVFAYHGAEHKTINAYEDGAELVPDVVSRYPLEHPRCGTGFLLVVMVVSVVIYSLLGDLPLLILYGSRIVFVPVIAAVAYEYIRFMARHLDRPIVRMLIAPQLALQRLTTREPSPDMLQVAIVALTKVLQSEAQPLENGPVVLGVP